MKQVKDKYTHTTLEQMPEHKLFRALMSGLNDSPRHIRELTRLLNGIKCRINLIRFHRIPDSPYFSHGVRRFGLELHLRLRRARSECERQQKK